MAMKEREPKFIWGIKSSDDLTGRPADLYTLNDFDIYYRYDTGSYYYSLETIYMFRTKEHEIEYLKGIYKQFTLWMRKKGYKTDYKPNLNDVFGMYPQGIGFKSIEELYAHFKMMCMGFVGINSRNHKKNGG